MLTQTFVSEEEYFTLLKDSSEKIEYHDGEIVSMAGANLAHNLISTNLTRLLGNCLFEGECMVLSSDMLVKLTECYKYVFPDLVIVCNQPVLSKRFGIDALENPNVIIEVLSDSTELIDRTEKFDCYKQLISVKEYILVASKKKKIEVFRRTENEEWLLHDYTEKDKNVKIGECDLIFEDIYRKVGFNIIEKSI
jgi:Uma2 family endonuclease